MSSRMPNNLVDELVREVTGCCRVEANEVGGENEDTLERATMTRIARKRYFADIILRRGGEMGGIAI